MITNNTQLFRRKLGGINCSYRVANMGFNRTLLYMCGYLDSKNCFCSVILFPDLAKRHKLQSMVCRNKIKQLNGRNSVVKTFD